MKPKALDLYILGVVTAAAVLAVTLFRFSVGVQLIAALLLVFVLPGYSLTALLFPGPRPGGPEKALFTIGLSICVAILTGVVLNFTPIGLQPAAWAITVSIITLIAGIFAFLRRKEAPQAANIGPRFEFKIREFVLLLGAVLLAGFAVFYSTKAQNTTAVEGYTVLWMGPSENSPSSVKVGIKSQELQEQKYRLVISANNQDIEAPFTILPGQEIISEIKLPGNISKGELVKAALYRQENPNEIFRQVYLWVK